MKNKLSLLSPSLLCATLTVGSAFAADPGPTRFEAKELLKEVLIEYNDGFGPELDISERTRTELNAVVNPAPLLPTACNGSTPFEVKIDGVTYLRGTFGDDPAYVPGNPRVSVTMHGEDFEGDPAKLGTVKLRWRHGALMMSARLKHLPFLAEDFLGDEGPVTSEGHAVAQLVVGTSTNSFVLTSQGVADITVRIFPDDEFELFKVKLNTVSMPGAPASRP